MSALLQATDLRRHYRVRTSQGLFAPKAVLRAVDGVSLTLRPGRTPLVTRLAQRVHLHFTAAMAAYTRRLTAAWVVYFVAMVGVSVTLYACAPWRWWSLFGNLLTPLAAAAFFVVEYGWRCRRHPEFERASLGAAWQAWRARPPSGAVR